MASSLAWSFPTWSLVFLLLLWSPPASCGIRKLRNFTGPLFSSPGVNLGEDLFPFAEVGIYNISSNPSFRNRTRGPNRGGMKTGVTLDFEASINTTANANVPAADRKIWLAIVVASWNVSGSFAPCCGADGKVKFGSVSVNCTPGKPVVIPAKGREDEFGDFSVDMSNVSKTKVKAFFNVSERMSAYYEAWIYLCDTGATEATPSSLYADGTVTFMNPYGYLPGEFYPYLPFYGWMTCFYLIFAVVWVILLYLNRQFGIIRLQYYVGGMIALGTIESIAFYFDHKGYNRWGKNYFGTMFTGVILNVIKETASRVLILVVAMGYGVVKPTIGSEKYKVGFLAIVYVFLSSILDLQELQRRTDPLNTTSQILFLVVPSALVNTAFFWWIFLSILRTINLLKIRKQSIKLLMYRRFLVSLGATCAAAVLVLFVRLIVRNSWDFEHYWYYLWVESAIWYLLYFVILVVIGTLWRPSSNNTRYEYRGDDDEIDDAADVLVAPMVLKDIVQRANRDDDGSADAKGARDDDEDLEVAFSIDDEEEAVLKGKTN